MKTLLQNPAFRFLSDLRLAAVLLVIFAIAAGVATWIESYYAGVGSTDTGRAAAYSMVFDALWFNVLLIMLFVNVLLNLVRRFARGRQPLGFLLVHVGMLVILVGAGMTRWYGYEGYLRIREGQANNMVASAKLFAVVSQGDDEAAMPLRLFKPGRQSHAKNVTVGGQSLTLGVSEYWTRFERSMMPGEGGIARVVLSTMGSSGMDTHPIQQGTDTQIGGVMVRFHEDGLPEATESTGRFGDLRVRIGDATCRIPVTAVPGLIGECAGWRFELAEFQSDYRVGGDSDPDGPMHNPMIRLDVTTPGGDVAEKILFALHPDFGMMHDEDELFAQVDLLYEYSSGIDIAKVDGQIVMRASFPFEAASMDGGAEGRMVAVGEVVPMQAQQLYRSESGFQAVASEVETSLITVAAQSQNPNAPDAARVYIEQNGERAEAICIHGANPQRVELAGNSYMVHYGSILSALPYELFLKDFLLETYPGSDNPASYESHVLLNDPDHGIEGQPVRIWMNHPLNHRGTKHFQSSYDRDRLGTVLSINRDPGKMPTYIGYSILSLGFALIIARIIGERMRTRSAAIAAGMVLLAAAGTLMPSSALAQDPGHGQPGHVHNEAPSAPPSLTLSPENLEAASQLIVQDYRGRMKPLDTLARETAIKITKRTRFEGREPVEVFLGYVVHPSAWYHYPSIHVKNPGVQDLVGVGRETHHVSLGSLLQGGSYKLQDVVEQAHRTSADKRNKTQQKLIVFDERVHILYGALQGTSLRIFPMLDDPANTWESIDTVLASIPEGDPRRAEYVAASEALFGGLAKNENARIREGLRLTAALQQNYGAEVLPSSLRVNSELTLNNMRPFAKSTLPYLLGFLLLIIAFFVGLFARHGQTWSWKNPLYAVGMLSLLAGFALHTYGFVLRWIASGRAPLSNGHESLLWVALAVALAGILFEFGSRTAAAGALGALLTSVVLGVAMMSTFDPAIGPLVPVLASYWLNIHVTIITASYGFLGLCCLLGMLTLVLYVTTWRGGPKPNVTSAIAKLDRLNLDVMIAGLGMLSIGTLLGGVWANESWGRYWGWDPKETWALVSILIYAAILHFRWIPKLNNPFVQATGSFLAIWSIIMTYFGVNYLLVGLHSYAAGEAVTVPLWVTLSFTGSVIFCIIGFFAWSDSTGQKRRDPQVAPAGGSA